MQVVSVDAMDSFADWPTKNEDFRFDPLDPSDVTWHRYSDEVRRVLKTCYEEVWVSGGSDLFFHESTLK